MGTTVSPANFTVGGFLSIKRKCYASCESGTSPAKPNAAGSKIYPNLIKNLFVTADITYIGIQRGFVYLAVILDLFARRAIGYSISRLIDSALCLAALTMAIAQQKPPKGFIHHSDRGGQYAAYEHVAVLLQYGFLISMSRKGNP